MNARDVIRMGGKRVRTAVPPPQTDPCLDFRPASRMQRSALPLTIAVGAGAEMRQSLGTAVFAGIIGVTLFGLLFTPTFYVFVRAFAGRFGQGDKTRLHTG